MQDKMKATPIGHIRLTGDMDARIRSMIEGLYLKIDYKLLADYFRDKLDPFAAGEFWGKMMRSACRVWDYTKDERLKKVIDAAFEDIRSIQGPDGEISSAPLEKQPRGQNGSDLWERKYVLLGLWEYWKATGREEALQVMCGLADYTCRQVGLPPKFPITETGWAFFGIESSSILEPIMRSYNVTGKEEYLALGRHIVEETGGCKRESIFAAIEQGKEPRDIGNNGKPEESIAKAYEMMSCYEGLVEYYRATGNERWKNLAVKFGQAVIDLEITRLGSGGADAPFNLGPGTGEQWNRSASEQTNPDINLMMETCVTITWMKLCGQLFMLSGDTAYMDQFERSLYNALEGAMRPDGGYFDYFPKFNGKRGGIVNYSFDVGGIPLSCCTANGPMGLAVAPGWAVTEKDDAVYVNLYLPGEYMTESGAKVIIDTEYPADGRITVTAEGCERVYLRIPAWCRKAELNGAAAAAENGWICAQGSQTLRLDLQMHCEAYAAPHGSNRAGDPYVLVEYGPLVMTWDKRVEAEVPAMAAGVKEFRIVEKPVACRAAIEVDGHVFIDYASAGATWDMDSEYASWLPMKA